MRSMMGHEEIEIVLYIVVIVRIDPMFEILTGDQSSVWTD